MARPTDSGDRDAETTRLDGRQPAHRSWPRVTERIRISSKRWPGPGCLTPTRGPSRRCRIKDLISPPLRFSNSRVGSTAAAPN